ncbi:MAG: LuxR C-terminal-related transcriptional regulator [Thermomicrobiales bacterium]
MSTKLFPPRSRLFHVARPQLVSWLRRDPDRRLTIVRAPAGYGKSTLVAQWLAEEAIPSAWLTLEASDGNSQRFFALIVTALGSLDHDLFRRTEELVANPRSFDTNAVVDQLVDDLGTATRPFVLVLDDYHNVRSAETNHAMSLLIERMPPAMRVVLIGRAVRSLRLAGLASHNDVLQLGPRELLFTDAEAVRFYRDGLGYDLSPDTVALIRARTQGWAAGLRLVGIAVRGQPRARARLFVEDHPGIVRPGDQSLWDEVIISLPDGLRWFLLRTSILDRFTAALCDAVTGADDGEDMIRRCERNHLFIIPLDDRGLWYRYHHLFADVLRDRLAQAVTDAEVADLHLRASRWLENAGLVEDAVRHAIAGRAWERAVGLLEDRCAELFDRDHVATLRAWLDGRPTAIFQRSPRLAFWLAWALGRSGRWVEGMRPLRMAQAAWSNQGDPVGRGFVLLWHAARAVYALENRRAIELAEGALDVLPKGQETARVMALMCRGMGHLYGGKPEAARSAFAEVRATIDASGRTWFRPFEQTYSSAVLALQGDLAGSAIMCRQVVEEAGESPLEIWVQPALRQLGDVLLEWGRLEEAANHYRRALDLAEQTRALHWPPRIHIGRARVAWARGESEEAFAELEQADEAASRANSPKDGETARAWQARFWLVAGQVALARHWADGCAIGEDRLLSYERQVAHLTHARLLIREGRPGPALRILWSLNEQAEADRRDGDRVEIAIVAALALKARGDAAGALSWLDRALALGEQGGYLRVFVDEANDVAPLLGPAAVTGFHRDYARRLLAEIERAAVQLPAAPSSVVETLSVREGKVLRLVASGLSNREISRQLLISEATVKKHVANVLRKLRTANRTEAVARARRLGLL